MRKRLWLLLHWLMVASYTAAIARGTVDHGMTDAQILAQTGLSRATRAVLSLRCTEYPLGLRT